MLFRSGTYAAKPNENAVAMSIVGSSFATFNGTVSERAIAFASDDQFVMTMRVPNSGVRTDLTWRRAGK